jgi:TonB family protein
MSTAHVFPLLVAAAWKSTAVLALAWLAAILARRRSAASRHLVWTAALAAVIVLPFLSISLPPLPVAAPSILFRTDVSGTPQTATPDRFVQPASATPPISKLAPVDWKSAVVLMWLLGAVAACAHTIAGYIMLWTLRRSARPLAPRGNVLETAEGSMPMTFGILKPVVLMPAGWDGERRRIALMHELAHIRRGDSVTQLFARAALAMYWWNPLAWRAWREFVKERERAADDMVLASGVKASDYAELLLDIARSMRSMSGLAVAMARPAQLEGRLIAILDPLADRRTPGRAGALLIAIAMMAVLSPLAAVKAQDTALPPDVDATIRAAMSQKNSEILERTAAAFEKLRQYDTARKLLDSAASIQADVSGTRSAEYGLAVLKIADLDRKRQGVVQAEPMYAKAVQLLTGRSESGRALAYLGIAAMAQNDLPKAAAYLEQAQAADPQNAGAALMWTAILREKQKQIEEADALFRRSLAMQDAKSVDATITMRVFDGFLRRQGREGEANTLSAQLKGMPPARALQASSTGPYRIGGDVQAPRLLSKVEPKYTDEARLAKLQGTVVMSIEVGADGVARNVLVVRGLGLGLDESAMAALGQWQFQPGVKNGEAVPVIASVEVNFHLL